MDQFGKLAEPIGAAATPIGDGLPRTSKEALTLGVTRYFTGRPCKRGHVAWRDAPWDKCSECERQRKNTPEYKEYTRQYRATPEQKEYVRQYTATPEYKEYKRQLQLSKAGDEILFAINQAERSARSGRSPADIITQCPEPQRSQLQAIVDRIKADPQAGKAVVGLLRTMRELRKAELAELRSEP